MTRSQAETSGQAMTRPRVTVVMPCYNAPSTIVDSIASVQSQRFGDWELIVIDDGSKDASVACVAAIAVRDPRVRLVEQPNSGPSVARNAGVKLGAGDIIAFLDSDDTWAPDHLALAVAMLDRDPALGLAFAPSRIVASDGSDTGQQTRAWTGNVTAEAVLGGNPTATCSAIVARRAVFATAGMMRSDMVHAEDQEWLFRVVHSGWGMRSHSVPTVGYRQSPNGLSANVERMAAGWKMFIAHARVVAPELVVRHLPQSSSQMHLYFGLRLLRDGRIGLDALSHLISALRASPRTTAMLLLKRLTTASRRRTE